MKRIIILAVVVQVVVLSLAGMGGVFATWSDSETSEDNMIETGSVDLKVNGADDLPWGSGVPSKVNIECMIPGKLYGPYEVELWHAGQCTQDASAYIHFKDFDCGNVLPKVNPIDPADGGSDYWPRGETTGYPDPSVGFPYSGDLKPEPELVAEYGGKVDCTEVPGVGALGDGCTMEEHVVVTVIDADTGNVIIDETPLIDLDCQEFYLFEMEPCVARHLHLWFKLLQPAEEDFGLNLIPNPGEDGYDPMQYAKFNDWPSWALMKDYVSFSMEFDLVLWDP
jgi:predicted ribosomally synthesized peptide with SipW-like signal peptide